MTKTKQPKRAPKGGAKPKAAQSKPTKAKPVPATAPTLPAPESGAPTADTVDTVGFVGFQRGEPVKDAPVDAPYAEAERRADAATPTVKPDLKVVATPGEQAAIRALCDAWGPDGATQDGAHLFYVSDGVEAVVYPASGTFKMMQGNKFLHGGGNTTVEGLTEWFRQHLPYDREWREKAAKPATANDENRAERRIEELEQRIQQLELTLEDCEERLRDARNLAAAYNTILVDARDSPHPDRPVFTNHGAQLLAVTAHLATTNVAERIQKALQAPRAWKAPQPNNEAAF